MNLEELKAQREKLDAHSDMILGHTQALIDETERVANIAHNARQINDDLDREFESQTGLDKTDIAFLFFATALQCVRWMLLPSLNFDFEKTPNSERKTAAQGGMIETKAEREYLNKNKDCVVKSSSKEFFTWAEIIQAPVPYDAMDGTQGIEIPGVTAKSKNLYGKNHHAATFGHDPLIGWVVGPLNIIARKITFTNFCTYNVNLTWPAIQKVTIPSSTFEMVAECFDSVSEDNKRLAAAVAKQGMHLASDKYTKMGLQIPGLSLISPAKAQALLEKGWNSEEAKKLLAIVGQDVTTIGVQAMCSALINLIVRAVHLLVYDESMGIERSLYEVKTRKILLYSNMIASSSNVIYVALQKDLSKLDVGGIAVTLYRLVSDTNFIYKVKEEFVQKRWHEMIQGNEELYNPIYSETTIK